MAFDPDFTTVSLLLNGQGTSIVDSSNSAIPITAVGNAATSAAQFPAITGASRSILLDGTGDAVTVPISHATNVTLGTGDFTLEFWVYPTVVPTVATEIFSTRYGGDNGFGIPCDSTGHLAYRAGGNLFATDPTALTVSTWHYFAFTRTGTTCNIYRGSSQVVTVTNASIGNSLTAAGNPVAAGLDWNGFDQTPSTFTGYIGPFRLSKGILRMTGATCVVPTAIFPTNGPQPDKDKIFIQPKMIQTTNLPFHYIGL